MGKFVKKTKKELGIQKRKNYLEAVKNWENRFNISKKDLQIVAVIFGTAILNAKIEFSKRLGWPDYDWEDFKARLPIRLIIGIVICGTIYLVRIMGAKPTKEESHRISSGYLICNRCEIVKKDDSVYICKCGGKYEDTSSYNYKN